MGRGCCRLDSCPTERSKDAKPLFSTKAQVQVRSEGNTNSRWNFRDVGLATIVTLVSVMCYVNSFNGNFVHDDIVAVSTNPDVLGHTSIGQLFLNDFWGKPMSDPNSHKSYRPLTILTFRLNMLLVGSSPTSFHIFSLVLHACVVLLLTTLCRNVLEWDRQRSCTAALLFATHPIHTEAVSSIVGRAELLSAVLFFGSFLSFYKSEEDKQSPFWLILSMVCATLALLAKEQGITVLPLCLGYHWICSRQNRRVGIQDDEGCIPRKDFSTLIICAVFACLVAFRVWMLNSAMPLFSDQDNPASFSPFLLTRCLTYAYLSAFNVWLLLAPITLSYDWQMDSIPLLNNVWDPRNIPTVVLYLSLLALLFRAFLGSKKTEIRNLYIAIGITVVTYLPASNLFVTVGFVVAERTLYLPSAGYCLLLTSGLYRLKQELPRYACLWKYLMFLLIILFFLRTVRRNQDWLSREALLTSGLYAVPNNAKIHYNYANLQKDKGNTELAIRHYGIALSLRSDHASAHNNLATLLSNETEAERHFRTAISINPRHSKAMYNLGNLYSKKGRYYESSVLLKEVIRLDPMFIEAYATLAWVKEKLKEFDEAETLHKKILRIQPHHADFLNNYGTFLQNSGRVEEAVKQYLRAAHLNPNHTVALVNAARTLKSLKHTQEAENLYKRALSIQDDPKVMDNLGVLYMLTGRLRQAQGLYKRLQEKYPDYIEGNLHYVQLLTQQRSYDEAERTLFVLAEKDKLNKEVFRHFAILYSHVNQTAEALDYILKALTLCSAHDVTCASLHAEHGDILKDIGDMDAAVKSYQMAIRLNSKLTHAHINLAVIKHLQGKCQEALRHYHEAYILEPDNQLLLDNMAKLHRHYPSMCPIPPATSCRSR